MGYYTEFSGGLSFDKPLSAEMERFLLNFSRTRHYMRNADALKANLKVRNIAEKDVLPPVSNITDLGENAKFFAIENGDETKLMNTKPKRPDPEKESTTDFLLFRLMGNDYTIDYNTPPSDCPSLWCDWYYDSATKEFKPSDGKTYEYIRWLEWLIKYIFNPADIKLNGEILWQGEDILDRGIIHVKDNVVETMT